MRSPYYLASSVTMVTSLLVHSRLLLCGRGLEGREEEEQTWELFHSNVLSKSTFLSELQTAALSYFPFLHLNYRCLQYLYII